MRTSNYREIRAHLERREPFNGNSMYGIPGGSQHMTGQLNPDEKREFLSAAARGIDYLVVSYRTPIAWIDSDGDRYVVAQKFSTTTSKHQGYVRAYLR